VESLKIILTCVLAAISYGILHDQVTARVCVEYFTIGHAPIFNTESPTLLALGWGVVATWWVGLFLGIMVAVFSRYGASPKFTAKELRRPLMKLLSVMALSSLAAGGAGYVSAQLGWVYLVGPIRSRVPEEKHVAFITDMWAHVAAYAVAFFGGLCICAWIVYYRRRKLTG